jgi:exonuclease III
MDALNISYKMLSWNVRGPNNIAKQEDIKQVINILKPDLVCLQETKLSSLDSSTVRNILGADYENSFLF